LLLTALVLMFPRGKVSATIAADGVTLFRLVAALSAVMGVAKRLLPCQSLFPGVPTAKRPGMLSKVAGAGSMIVATCKSASAASCVSLPPPRWLCR
jgi:hypothetical protein